MSEWYRPDERWPTLGMGSRDAYVQAYVFAGRFHAGVPRDVVQAYETASHLMAQAWYHYPLYDEALAKLLFLQEVAIKLRCKQLGIPSTFSHNGKRRSHTLQTFIDALDVAEPTKGIAPLLHRARGLRNHFAHPELHGYAGGLFRHHVLPLLNVLNDLFLEDQLVAQGAAYVAQLRQQRGELGMGLLVLEGEDGNALLTDAQPLAAQQVRGEWRVIWHFSQMIPRILGAITALRVPKPILRVLTEIDIGKENMFGQDLKTGETVQIRSLPAAHSEALRKPYEAEIRQASEENFQLFGLLQVAEVAEAIQELRYSYFWN